MNIIQEVKKLNLSIGQYAVIGSGPMAVRDIRQANDIDFIVTQELYDKLVASGWQKEHFEGKGGPWGISHGVFEANTSWSVNDYHPDPQQLINDADVIDGVAFIRLEDVVQWKKACAREKDLKDIELIKTYLASQ
jgi:hypothetical protein